MLGPKLFGKSLAWFVPILAEAGALGRSIAFAWLIGPDELGQAMILALTVRLVEMSSDVGIDRLLVQARDGQSQTLQAGLQGASVLRGLAAAGFIIISAPLLALVFEDGPDALSYACLAAVPLVRGFVHLDFRRAERRFRYVWMSVVEGGATVSMVLAVMPAVWALGDHRAMAAVLFAHALTHTLLSHVVAGREYTLSFDAEILRRCWTFGAPLILNAILLFLTFYADRVIVARAYDWASVAIYGVALRLAVLPAQIVGRAAASLVLPSLRAALARKSFPAVWSRIVTTHVAMAVAVGFGFSLLAPSMIALVYGGEFRPDGLLAAAVAVAAATRIVRTPYSQLAIATGRTADPARANVFRAMALVPACIFAAAQLPLFTIGLAAALGEAAAALRAHQLSLQTTQDHAVGEVFS